MVDAAPAAVVAGAGAVAVGADGAAEALEVAVAEAGKLNDGAGAELVAVEVADVVAGADD